MIHYHRHRITSRLPGVFFRYIALLVIIGTIGYYIIGGERWSLVDSLYMTIITLTTVGYGEVYPLDAIGKIWTVILIIFGVSGFAVMLTQFGEEIMEYTRFRRRRMDKKISKMKNHYIVCGYGRMGAVIADELAERKQPFLIIENNEKKIPLIEEMGYHYIYGDASSEDVLQFAGIERAKGVIIVLDSDQDNLFVIMSVKALNPNAYVVSRSVAIDSSRKLIRAGADKVVNPYIAGGHKMSELLLSPFIKDTVALETTRGKPVDLAIDEINLGLIDHYDGIMIKDSKLREEYNLMIVGIIDEGGDLTLNPPPETVLKHTHTIMVIGDVKNLERFKQSIAALQ
jgi:voltage-gated potassium channel